MYQPNANTMQDDNTFPLYAHTATPTCRQAAVCAAKVPPPRTSLIICFPLPQLLLMKRAFYPRTCRLVDLTYSHEAHEVCS